MNNSREFSIDFLAKSIEGKIFGNSDFSTDFTGRFTFLNDSKKGDIVIRHWVNSKGIEIAKSKNISCFITENPKDNAIETAKSLNIPLIVTNKIELANAFALKWTIETYSPDSKNIAITGTNGKSTTSDLIYHILKENKFNVFTNTDSESEFNTLIDPVVSKMISDTVINEGNLDFLVIEISEVQGWLGSLMKNHSGLMAKAINPTIATVTNIAMDHIGLVDSIDDVFNEISTFVKVLNKCTFVYNEDNALVKKLLTFKNNSVKLFPFSMDSNDSNDLYYDDNREAIFYKDKLVLNKKQLPFLSNHFIENILIAIAICLGLNIPLNGIIDSIKSYKSLNRRFSILNEKPFIIDDFAHNPDAIKSTISESLKLLENNGDLHIICSIRGSRGEDINKLNAVALAEVIDSKNNLILTSSSDVVDNLNFVKTDERKIFEDTLNDYNIDFTHYENLYDALKETLLISNDNDLILLIGAQGMDSASKLLKEIF